MIEILSASESVKSNQPLIIFDRDDTLIENIPSLKSHIDIKWLPNRLETLVEIMNSNVNVAIATNQACIGKGNLTEKDYIEVSNAILKKLADVGVVPIAIIACPHSYEEVTREPICYCRKPNPGMLERILEIHGRKNKNALFVGDSKTDYEATLKCESQIDFIYSETDGQKFYDLVKNWILSLEHNDRN